VSATCRSGGTFVCRTFKKEQCKAQSKGWRQLAFLCREESWQIQCSFQLPSILGNTLTRLDKSVSNETTTMIVSKTGRPVRFDLDFMSGFSNRDITHTLITTGVSSGGRPNQ